jgi:hypothetical protein
MCWPDNESFKTEEINFIGYHAHNKSEFKRLECRYSSHRAGCVCYLISEGTPLYAASCLTLRDVVADMHR